MLYKAIKKEAGLSDWDADGIWSEINAIKRALERNDFVIMKRVKRPSGLYEFISE